MRTLTATALFIILSASAHAQSAYTQGYNAGLNDRYPSSEVTANYANGFRAGQNEASDDDQEFFSDIQMNSRPSFLRER